MKTEEDLTKNYISIPQLAAELGITRMAVYKKVKSGQIKGVKIGRNYVISRDFLRKQIDCDKYISVAELAKALGVSRVAINQKIDQGIIKAKKIGRNFVVSREYLRMKEGRKSTVTIPVLAKRIGKSRVHVFQKIKTGEIKAVRDGSTYRISKEYIKKRFDVDIE